MKASLRWLAAVLLAMPLSAQWLHYPTAGVPKKSDGSPNLEAPAPRTADGKPDFSGMWDVEHNRPCPDGGCADMMIGQEFMDIGWSLKGGLPYQPWAAKAVKERTEQNGRDDPTSYCRPAGIVKLHTSPFFRKIVQVPGLIVILIEVDTGYRQIFTDGRALPADPEPTPNGYSTAKWEGETLVVQSIGFEDGMWLDRNGSPMSDAARITERWRRPNFGKLEIELTVDDPKAYTKPWTVKLNQFIVLNTEMIDSFCNDNEKSDKHMVGK
jgi:hypothetical protein